MTPIRVPRRVRAAAIAGAFAVAIAACGGSSNGGDSSAPAAAPTTAPATAPTTAPMNGTPTTERTSPPMGGGESAMSMPSGPGCAAVPSTGPGSFAGMATDPAATAASNNPVLSTLVTAVVEAGLVDTLNSTGPFTIFAPTNDAFAAIPQADLAAVLADEELLTGVLTYHVVAGERLTAAELAEAGTVTTVAGGVLRIDGAGDTIRVNGAASAVCQDVPTANAVVHIIDGVLMP